MFFLCQKRQKQCVICGGGENTVGVGAKTESGYKIMWHSECPLCGKTIPRIIELDHGKDELQMIKNSTEKTMTIVSTLQSSYSQMASRLCQAEKEIGERVKKQAEAEERLIGFVRDFFNELVMILESHFKRVHKKRSMIVKHLGDLLKKL